MRTSLVSLSLFFQQCLECLLCLIWMVLEIGGSWPHSFYFVWCWFQDLFNITRSIFVHSRQAVWNKLRFILSDRLDFYIIGNLLIAVHVFAKRWLMTFSVDETLLPRYVNLSTNFGEPPYWVEMSPFWLKQMDFLSAFTWRPVPPAACSTLCSWDSALVGICIYIYIYIVICTITYI